MSDQFLWIDRISCRLCCTRSGSGPEIAVLIHELGGSIASWDGVVDRLYGMVLIRYDQRGHGASTTPDAPYSLVDQVEDLRAVLDHAASARTCWLIAAAAGASIAVEFAARYSGRVAGIVMCAPALEVDGERRDYLLNRAEVATRHGMSGIVDAALARSWPATLLGDGQAYSRYRDRFVASCCDGYALAILALCRIDLNRALALLACPCLVLAGEHDSLRPPGRLLAQALRIARAEFETVPAGHLMAVQCPDEVSARIAAFIARSRA